MKRLWRFCGEHLCCSNNGEECRNVTGEDKDRTAESTQVKKGTTIGRWSNSLAHYYRNY